MKYMVQKSEIVENIKIYEIEAKSISEAIKICKNTNENDLIEVDNFTDESTSIEVVYYENK